jgi:hypothetical protein
MLVMICMSVEYQEGPETYILRDTQTMVAMGIFSCNGKFPPEIEPGTAWVE